MRQDAIQPPGVVSTIAKNSVRDLTTPVSAAWACSHNAISSRRVGGP
jgi:hypothetical protein